MASLKTVFTEKCPRCGEGDLFEHKKHFTFSGKSYQMKKHCPDCGLKYEKEVGFFYGAMFISYALNIALFLSSLLVYYLFFKSVWGWVHFAVVYFILTILATAYIFRLSRSMWISLLTKSEPDILHDKKKLLAEEWAGERA